MSQADFSDAFPLFDTLKRYKVDTAIFVSWLGETAKKCGFTEHITTSASEKGKKKTTRKTGKKNAKPPPKTLIPLRQFPALAQAIANSESNIPLEILLTLKSLIRARGECADWFSCQAGDEKQVQGNEGHRYAIHIFKEVLGILLPKRTDDGKSAKKSPRIVGNQGKVIELANSFGGLDVEDITSEMEEAATQDPYIKRKQKSFERVYELEESLDDYYMETFFFFGDLHKLRLYVKQLWQDYRDGKVDLASVSVTTEAAFDLLERNERDLYESLAHLTSYECIDDYQTTGAGVWMKICMEHRLDDLDFHPELYHIQDSLCFHTFLFLKTYLVNQLPCQITIEPCEETQDIVLDRDRESLSPREKQDEDKDILWALLPDIQVLPAIAARNEANQERGKITISGNAANAPIKGLGAVGRGVSNDKLAKGLLAAQETGKIPIWLVFAVQTLVDIFHIMRYQIGPPLGEVFLTAAKHRKSLVEYFTFSPDKDTSSFSDIFNASIFKNLDTFINEWVYEDKIGKFRALVSPNLKRSHQFWLLTYHPMLCGAFIFSMNLTMQVAGRTLAHMWGYTIAAIHLYNASMKTAFSKVPWPDMDCLISIHGEDYLFFGGAPKNPRDYCTKFWLSMGNSISNFAKDRRPNQPTRQTEPRKLVSVASVSKIFEERYCDTFYLDDSEYKNGKKVSSDSMQLLRNKARLQKETPSPSESSDISQEFLTPYKGHLKKERRALNPDNLSPIQLLEAICISVNSEYTALNIDYIAIHMRCMRLLREIHEEIKALCKSMYEHCLPGDGLPDNFDSDEVLGVLPYYILRSHAEIGHAEPKSSWKTTGERGRPASILLVKAAKIVERVAREDGSRELDKVRTLKEKCGRVRAVPPQVVRIEEDARRDFGEYHEGARFAVIQII